MSPLRLTAMTVFAAITVTLVWHFWPEPVITYPPGVLCPEAPEQGPPTRRTPWLIDDFMITPLADFHLRGRVLHRHSYSFGRESDLSPVDFALGWGRMSDQRIIDCLDISQGGRWYSWKAPSSLPIPRREVERSSANMHIVPASEAVRDALDEVSRGCIVDFGGYLIKATRDDGWHWVSSLSRNDVGNGACEIVWVERLTVER
jgi:hypothetical protein